MAASSAASPKANPPEIRLGSERELVIVMQGRIDLRVSPTGLVVTEDPALGDLQTVLTGTNASIRPLFGSADAQTNVLSDAPPLSRPLGAPDLSGFFKIDAPDEHLEEIAEKVRSLEPVRAAYIKPPTEPPILNSMAPTALKPASSTPDFTPRQVYLNAAPGGIDARFAWTRPGGRGKGVAIVDIEGEWRSSHEDLQNSKSGITPGTPAKSLGWRNHGTAVLGEFGADNNGIGVTGICSEANITTNSIFPKIGSSEAIRLAATRLEPGDIILVELHRPGPRYGFVQRNDQAGYIPIEWWPDDFAVIQFATQRGIVVIAAGGNGGENLDDNLYDLPQQGFAADWKNPLKRSNRDSGAILVGAGAPPPKTHGRDHGPDRSRLDFSNYGSSIDAQGWGQEVTTCGYGDLQGGKTEDRWYTDEFAGTSSASPIVVGAVGCVQGVLSAAGAKRLTPAEVRQWLRSTGSPQTDAPGRPKTQRIGNRPNLREILDGLAEDSKTKSVSTPRVKKKRSSSKKK